jgi:hypothetical protein
MDPAVQRYIDAIPEADRPLFERIRLQEHPLDERSCEAAGKRYGSCIERVAWKRL